MNKKARKNTKPNSFTCLLMFIQGQIIKSFGITALRNFGIETWTDMFVKFAARNDLKVIFFQRKASKKWT